MDSVRFATLSRNDFMLRPVKIITVILLVLTLGLHWALLQTVAWTGMIVSYSRNGSLTEAVSKTFDGQHPCCLCKAIQSGRKAEQEQAPEKLTPDAKIKGVLPPETAFLYAPACVELPAPHPVVYQSFRPEPPTPPPRSARAV